MTSSYNSYLALTQDKNPFALLVSHVPSCITNHDGSRSFLQQTLHNHMGNVILPPIIL